MKKSVNGLPAIQYMLFDTEQTVSHACFLRHGGVSMPPYDTLNVGENTEDEPASVKKNIDRVLAAIEAPMLATMKQVHGKKVCAVSKPGEYECDALITQEKGLALMARHADCQAGLFYDPVTRTIGAVHAGWKGLTLNIYQEVVLAMNAAYDVRPENLLVGIGPSLGLCHAEFVNYQTEFPKELHSFRREDSHFDLWGIAKMQLTDAGIRPENIELCEMCTFDAKNECFSYRREKETGRHASIIALKQDDSV